MDMGHGGEGDHELIHKELSYEIVGGLFDVHNAVGAGLREESHQDAYTRWLGANDIPFVAKPATRRPVIYKGREADTLEPDFDIDGKIILELKAKREGLAPSDEAQTLNYVKLWGCRLGILANMAVNEVKPKRLPYSPAPPRVEQDYSAIKDIMTDELRPIAEACRQSLLEIHKEVGVGYTNTIYRKMLLVELSDRGLSHDAEVEVTPTFHGEPVARSPITSVLVEGQVLVEVTALNDEISASDRRVVQTYLKLTGASVGLIGCFSRDALLIRGARPPAS